MVVVVWKTFQCENTLINKRSSKRKLFEWNVDDIICTIEIILSVLLQVLNKVLAYLEFKNTV